MELVPLDAAYARLVASWFAADPVGERFLGFYRQSESWWSLVRDGPERHGWLVTDGGRAVGFVDLEIESPDGHVVIYVVTVRRRQGLARHVFDVAAHAAATLGALELVAGVDPANTASLRAHQRAGFEAVGVDESGHIVHRRPCSASEVAATR